MTILLFHSGGAKSLHQHQQPRAVEGDETGPEEEAGTGDVDLRRETVRSGAVRRLDHGLRC